MFGRGKSREQWTTVEYVVWTDNTSDTNPPVWLGFDPAGSPADMLAEDFVRRIVREELADLLPIDVPDTPPEDLR